MASVNARFCCYPAFVVAALSVSLAGCGIHVKEKDNGKGDKEVTIQTPVADLHVGKDVKGADTGMSVYPGARLVEKDDDGGSARANVNISTPIFDIRLVVVKYASDDAPQKLVDFYSNDLKRYGKILRCTKSGEGDWNVGLHSDDKQKNKNDLTCNGDGKGDTIELKVGSDNNAHIVAVSPKGTGSEFALVYVRTRGDSDNTI